jgi:hypothetical protein
MAGILSPFKDRFRSLSIVFVSSEFHVFARNLLSSPRAIAWDVVGLGFVPGIQSYSILSVFMPHNSHSPLTRRRFLGLGILAGILGTAGCNGEGAIQKVDTPPSVPSGNRTHLEKMQKTAENLPPPKKTK